MRRRDFIPLLGGAAAWPVAARAQQPTTRVARIGWLVTGDPTSYQLSLAAFRDGLRALNYIEGQNIAIEYRWAGGVVDRLPELARDLVHEKVNVILAGGTIGARVARDATQTIPIVVAGAGDLVEVGLIRSLAQPGGNLTGFVTAAPETTAKRGEIIKEMFPQAKRAAVLWNPTAPNTQLEMKALKESALALQLALTSYEASTAKDLENALNAIPNTHPHVVFVLNDPFMFARRKRTVESLFQAHLPAIFGYREYVDDGGLVSYGSSVSDSYRRAATYVDKILKGAKPGDLPVQLPTKFELVINLKTAKALGLTVPLPLLDRADEVIE
jgi:putative tryptophan/tyrosine transport system substrate-binding protein